MNFDTWLNQVPEKKPTKVDLNTSRVVLTEMCEDLDRMLSECDTIRYFHPMGVSERQPLYNNNMYEEEWELYKGITPYESR